MRCVARRIPSHSFPDAAKAVSRTVAEKLCRVRRCVTLVAQQPAAGRNSTQHGVPAHTRRRARDAPALHRPLQAGRREGAKPVARCELYAIPTREEPGYRWRWRAIDGQARSKGSFQFFYECMEDARSSGHAVDLEATLAAAREYGKAPGK
jgi:hypothetical protein